MWWFFFYHYSIETCDDMSNIVISSWLIICFYFYMFMFMLLFDEENESALCFNKYFMLANAKVWRRLKVKVANFLLLLILWTFCVSIFPSSTESNVWWNVFRINFWWKFLISQSQSLLILSNDKTLITFSLLFFSLLLLLNLTSIKMKLIEEHLKKSFTFVFVMMWRWSLIKLKYFWTSHNMNNHFQMIEFEVKQDKTFWIFHSFCMSFHISHIYFSFIFLSGINHKIRKDLVKLQLSWTKKKKEKKDFNKHWVYWFSLYTKVFSFSFAFYTHLVHLDFLLLL
jgi:hypothetical protein